MPAPFSPRPRAQDLWDSEIALAEGASLGDDSDGRLLGGGNEPSRGRQAALVVGGLAAACCGLVALAAASGAGGGAERARGVRLIDAVEFVEAEEDPCHKLRDSEDVEDGKSPCELPEAALHIGSHHSSHKHMKCAANGEDCSHARCCAEEGMQCYEKEDGWAMCMPECKRGVDLRGPDMTPWSCKELGDRNGDRPPACAGPGEDCASSHCCNSTGYTCYEKMPGSAKCKVSCSPGPDPTDQDDSKPWSCKTLGETTPGVSKWVEEKCAAGGASCLKEGCCAQEGMQCYAKDDGWAECHYGCVDPEKPWMGDGWSCEEIGPRTPHGPPKQEQGEVAAWVEQECSKAGENCTESRCCAQAGTQCYQRDKSFAACKASCDPGPDLFEASMEPWTCKALGSRTPGFAESKADGKTPVSDWVSKKCTKSDGDCRKTRCCREPGEQCFVKNDGWAACAKFCDAGEHSWDNNETWACDALGPKTPRLWGKPSLFCFAVAQINEWSEEAKLIRGQIERGAGIFLCDEYAVFSTAEATFMGVGPLGKVVSIPFEPAEIVTSKDGTSGNAELFMHVWDAVRDDGRYSTVDWTVKVDPDAVLIPERLRGHLKPHTGKAAYIVNCDKPYMPEGPMMFGALEAISGQALDTYFAREEECIGGMYWKEWGEDWFMGHCLDFLQVEKVDDFSIYSDGVCKGVDCSDSVAAAFHPKKDIDSWVACFEEAMAAGGRAQSEEGSPEPDGESNE